MRLPAIKYHWFFLPIFVMLICQCKKESVVTNKLELADTTKLVTVDSITKTPIDTNCFDVSLLTKEGYWYDDKNYNQHYFRRFDGGPTSGRISRWTDSMYDGGVWQIKCDTFRFQEFGRSYYFNGPIPRKPCPQGFCVPGLKIHTLTKSVFEYGERGKLFNPAGDENGNIAIKSDVGDYIFNKIIGMEHGVNTIFNTGFKIVRFNDAFPQLPITIGVTDIDIDTITYPYRVPTERFLVTEGYHRNESNAIYSNLIITEFKNDTLKGTFSAKLKTFDITEGTFSMRMYRVSNK